MTTEELKSQYNDLYERMAASRNTDYMKVFGKVMTEMYDWFSINKREVAEEWLMKLESIKWNNFLTPAEAENIVSEMIPKALWSRDTWQNAMQSLGLEIENEPRYNSCALWVVMNMIYSDHGNSIANLINQPLESIPVETIVPAIYSMAIDLLCDKDKRFNVRKYFSV